VSIVDETAAPILTRGLAEQAGIDPAEADASAAFFSLRMDLARDLSRENRVFTWTENQDAPEPSLDVAAVPLSPMGRGRVSIVMERAGTTADITHFEASFGNTGWRLLLQHAAGSLDAVVAQTRRHNLYLSFGILALLAASVGLIVFNARRSERLAEQQMDFVATVSHELRTPLAVIRSAAQNLSAGVIHDAEQAKRYGELIDGEGRRLADMVEQVLEYAGLSGNRKAALATPIDVGLVVRDTMDTRAALVEAEGVELSLDIEPDLPAVAADEDAIRRALHNLVTNALKYGADGRWLAVTVRGAKTSGRAEVQVSVSDRGRGIDPGELTHIFDPFYRGRYAIDRQIHGNGLGLSLVQRIAEAHGGRVSVTSARGEGTTFTLHLPAVAPNGAVRPLAGPVVTNPGGHSA
jgi:signal transduction histidine kinase